MTWLNKVPYKSKVLLKSTPRVEPSNKDLWEQQDTAVSPGMTNRQWDERDQNPTDVFSLGYPTQRGVESSRWLKATFEKKSMHVTTAKDEAARLLRSQQLDKETMVEVYQKIQYAIDNFLREAGDKPEAQAAVGILERAKKLADEGKFELAATILENLDTLPIEERYNLEPIDKTETVKSLEEYYGH